MSFARLLDLPAELQNLFPFQAIHTSWAKAAEENYNSNEGILATIRLLGAVAVDFGHNQRLENLYRPISARLNQEWSRYQLFLLLL